MENSHRHENSKDSEATLGIEDIFGQRIKEGQGIRFQVRMGYLQVVDGEWNIHKAGKSLLGDSETRGHRGYLANRLLLEALYHI